MPIEQSTRRISTPVAVRLRVELKHQNEEFDLELTEDCPIRIGRANDADVSIRSTSVSRQHCRMVLENDFVFVEDAGSSGGTFFFGSRIECRKLLRDEDVLTLGAARIHVGFPGRRSRLRGGNANDTDGEEETPPHAEHSPNPEHSTTVAARIHSPWRESQHTVFADTGSDLSVGAPPPSDEPHFELTKNLMSLGSSPDSDFRLDHLMVSRRHATVRRRGRAWFIEDLKSTNGTFINGSRLRTPHALEPGDVIRIGPYALRFEGNSLTARSLETTGLTISARSLSKDVVNKQTGESLRLLNDVSFTIRPGQFVGLLGPSGCGKSTLMDALNGRRPCNSGFVHYNQDDLFEDFESYKSGIGYVPQEVIFHDALTPHDVLLYASKLRLPSDVGNEAIEKNIDEVLQTVGLSERKHTVIRNLSGGQKKRVSLAIELISKPMVLFLDEVTSGLDLASERDVMDLCRRLSDGGLTIVCITHFVDSLDRCDALVCLMRGRMVFHGSPANFRRHFGIQSISDVYGLEKRQSPEQWEESFRSSLFHAPPPPLEPGQAHPQRNGKGFDAVKLRTQVPVLTSRYVKLLVADRTMPAVLLALAPAIAVLLCILTRGLSFNFDYPSTPDDLLNFKHCQSILSFGSVLTVLFLALFGAVQEVVKELRVYHHERSNNLMVVPYMLSKIMPLSAIGLAQVLMVVAVVNLFGRMRAGSIIDQVMVLTLTSWVGTMLGLVISAAVPEGNRQSGDGGAAATTAVTVMNAVVIPQVLFAGAMVAVTGASAWIAKTLITAYWSYQPLLARLDALYPDKVQAVVSAQSVPSPAATQAASDLLKQLTSNSPGFWPCVFVLAAHWAIAFVVLFALLVRKDGQDAFKRLYAAIPRDAQGRIATQTLIKQAKQLVGAER